MIKKNWIVFGLVMVAAVQSGCSSSSKKDSSNEVAANDAAANDVNNENREPAQAGGALKSLLQVGESVGNPAVKTAMEQAVQTKFGQSSAALIGTANESAAVNFLKAELSNSNSPLSKKVSASGADLRQVSQAVDKAAAQNAAGSNARMDAAPGQAAGSGKQASAAEIANFTKWVSTTTKGGTPKFQKEFEASKPNVIKAYRINPAMEMAYKNMVKGATDVSHKTGTSILGPMTCLWNGHLNDPEAIKNAGLIMSKLNTSYAGNAAKTWDKVSTDVIGRSTREKLVAPPCDILNPSTMAGASH